MLDAATQRMKTRVAIRDKNTHFFELMPLNDTQQRLKTSSATKRENLPNFDVVDISPLNIMKRNRGHRRRSTISSTGISPSFSSSTTLASPTASTRSNKFFEESSPSPPPKPNLDFISQRSMARHTTSNTVDVFLRSEALTEIDTNSTFHCQGTRRQRPEENFRSLNSNRNSKRHAIYTRSLYVGSFPSTKEDLHSVVSLSTSTLSSTSTHSLKSSNSRGTTMTTASSPSSDTLDSILGKYTCGSIPPHTSMPSLYSEDSWGDYLSSPTKDASKRMLPKPILKNTVMGSNESDLCQDQTVTNGRGCTEALVLVPKPKLKARRSVGRKEGRQYRSEEEDSHHPIIMELLRQVEVAQETWVWD